MNSKTRKGTNALQFAAKHGGSPFLTWKVLAITLSEGTVPCLRHTLGSGRMSLQCTIPPAMHSSCHMLTLWWRCHSGHLNVVELLIKRHANVKAQDKKGQSALDLATDDAVKAALQAALQEQKQAASEPAKKVIHDRYCLTHTAHAKVHNAAA